MTTANLITGAISGLLLFFQHYAILVFVRLIWRQKLPTLPRYIIGTLAVNGSLTVMFWISPNEPPAESVIVVTTMSGLFVLLAYAIDWALEAAAQRHEQNELDKIV
jgi:hypothetical protein